MYSLYCQTQIQSQDAVHGVFPDDLLDEVEDVIGNLTPRLCIYRESPASIFRCGASTC